MKKKKRSAFEAYNGSLSGTEQALLAEYFSHLHARIRLPKHETERLIADFEQAVLTLVSRGEALSDILVRLSPEKMGGFYARPPILWFPLDDAAKVYPMSMKHGQMAVFRLSMYLTEDVLPELLQVALAFTVKRFPTVTTTVKKGVFWHYLDTTKRRYVVEPERGAPCRPLNISRSRSQSFRVIYYQNRISVEFFHVLVDGAGGMVFLKTLTAEYLRLLGVEIPAESGVFDIGALPADGEAANDFPRVKPSGKTAGFSRKPAVQMSGELTRAKPCCRALHVLLSADALKAAANRRDATVTAYVLSRMFSAGKCATDGPDGTMCIQVPVNMRKYYPSETVRNFALYGAVSLPLREIVEADAILPEITRQLRESTSREAMDAMMNATERMVRAARYLPLFIKAPIAQFIYDRLGDKGFSNTLSNLGAQTLPEAMARHVKSMDFVLGTGITNRVVCSLVSLNGIATLTIAKLTADPSFEEALCALFEADGLAVEVEGSLLYEH